MPPLLFERYIAFVAIYGKDNKSFKESYRDEGILLSDSNTVLSLSD